MRGCKSAGESVGEKGEQASNCGEVRTKAGLRGLRTHMKPTVQPTGRPFRRFQLRAASQHDGADLFQRAQKGLEVFHVLRNFTLQASVERLAARGVAHSWRKI